MAEEKEDNVSFVLVINRKLWETFCETIPPYYTRNDALVEIIKDRIKNLYR